MRLDKLKNNGKSFVSAREFLTYDVTNSRVRFQPGDDVIWKKLNLPVTYNWVQHEQTHLCVSPPRLSEVKVMMEGKNNNSYYIISYVYCVNVMYKVFYKMKMKDWRPTTEKQVEATSRSQRQSRNMRMKKLEMREEQKKRREDESERAELCSTVRHKTLFHRRHLTHMLFYLWTCQWTCNMLHVPDPDPDRWRNATSCSPDWDLSIHKMFMKNLLISLRVIRLSIKDKPERITWPPGRS